MDMFSMNMCTQISSQNDSLIFSLNFQKFEFSNVIIEISKLFETKDGIFVKNVRQVPLMSGNLALGTNKII